MEGHLRLSYCGTIKDITEGIERIKWALDPELAQRTVPRRPQTGEGLAMNAATLDIASPAQKRPAQNASDFGLENHGLTKLHRVYWNLPDAGALRRGGLPRRGPHRRTTARSSSIPASTRRARRPTSSSSASRPPRTRSGGASTTGRSARKVQRSADAAAGLSAGPRRLRPGLLRRRRPGLPLPIRIITENAWHSLFARNMFIQAEEPRRDEAARARVHGHRARRVSRRRPSIDGTRTRNLHHRQLRRAHRHHRRHGLRRRDQEDHLHGAELPAAARRRAADALLGQRRRPTATWRSSSACPAPARPRCRPTRRAS